jgi:hypothetical protein
LLPLCLSVVTSLDLFTATKQGSPSGMRSSHVAGEGRLAAKFGAKLVAHPLRVPLHTFAGTSCSIAKL